MDHVPAPLTSFIGREDELAAVRRLLAGQRLVTLAGSGGCGKTRLALQAVAGLTAYWPDGVWWIDLGSVAEAALIPEVIATNHGLLVEPAGGPMRALVYQLRSARLLICLDTCEHVIDGVAALVEALLGACPSVSVLATSREPLGVAGEKVWRVPSLREEEAVRLFADRAALVRPGFTVATDPEAVRAICRRLDGIPLAVELAAAWVRALTPAQIAAGVLDRFRLLGGGSRRAVARHRTLAASMEWSHHLLADRDRVMLRRLAVFAGGFTLDAAEAVCEIDGDALASLAGLVDKSMVLTVELATEVRYRLLDTIRQYAEDRLQEAGESSAFRDRHLDYFLAYAEAAETGLDVDQDRSRAALEGEHDNLRAALDWGLAADDPTKGRRLAAGLARYWFSHGYTHEGLDYLRRAIDTEPDGRTALQASLFSGVARVACGGGRAAQAAEAAAHGLAIAADDDRRNRARCLAMSAFLPFFTDFRAAQRLCIDAQRYGEAAGDLFAIDFAKLLHACSETNQDRHDRAVALVREFLPGSIVRGDRFCAAFGLAVEAWAALFGGELHRAADLGRRSLAMATPLNSYLTTGLTTFNLAWIEGLLGDIEAGRRRIEPVVRSLESAGSDADLVPWLSLMPGKLALWSGDAAGALPWLRRATQFAEPVTDNWITARALPNLAGALRLLGRHGEARSHAERAIALARALDVPHALAEALDEAARLDPLQAEDLYHQSLAVRVEHGLRTFYVDSLEGLAALLAGSPRPDQAGRLLAACDAARDASGYERPVMARSVVDAAAAAIREAIGDEAYTSVRAEGESLSLDEAVRYATRGRGPRGRPSHGWSSLTRAESEVARLVVDGLTNIEIGQRLFVTRATVKTHLSSIYAKLGVANRTELATLVATATRSGFSAAKAGADPTRPG